MQDRRDERFRRRDYLYAISEILAAGRRGIDKATQGEGGGHLAVSVFGHGTQSMHMIQFWGWQLIVIWDHSSCLQDLHAIMHVDCGVRRRCRAQEGQVPHGGNMCAGRELKSVVLRARPSRVPLVVAVIAATLKDTSIPRTLSSHL